ncbi:MAG TPA: STAS domain-containing protein [Gammaproteobacteria bacterium]
MSFTVQQDTIRDGGLRLRLAGRLDSVTAPQFEASVDGVLGFPPPILVLDLAALDYISSAGLRIVFKLQKAVKAAGGKLLMLNMQPPVRKVFEIIDALPSLSVFSSVAELDDYLDHMQAKERDK